MLHLYLNKSSVSIALLHSVVATHSPISQKRNSFVKEKGTTRVSDITNRAFSY